MNRGVFILALLAVVLPAQAGEFWSKLWRNADQRGEALMRQGDAKNAANEYADPSRKAFAKLKAGDYQGAAKDLASVQGSDAAYNRGNALAYSGDLQGALAAYDAALKADPNNQDAKHNRDLVAQQLKQQNGQSPKSGSQNNGQGKSGDSTGADKQQGDRQGQSASGQNPENQNSGNQKSGNQNTGKQNMGKQNADNQNMGKQNEQGSNQQNQNQAGQHQGDNATSANAGDDKNVSYNHDDTKYQKAQPKSGNGAQQQGQQPADQHKANGQQQSAGAAKDEAEQARRDAEASLGQATAGEKNDGENKSGASDGFIAPKTENQLAQEQWLRSIPDDPAGLLRRKFMIEHLIRQQKAQQ